MAECRPTGQTYPGGWVCGNDKAKRDWDGDLVPKLSIRVGAIKREFTNTGTGLSGKLREKSLQNILFIHIHVK